MFDEDQKRALRLAAVIAEEIRERLVLRSTELANCDELGALQALAEELEDWADEDDTENVLEGLRAVAGGLEPTVINDTEPEEGEDAEPIEE